MSGLDANADPEIITHNDDNETEPAGAGPGSSTAPLGDVLGGVYSADDTASADLKAEAVFDDFAHELLRTRMRHYCIRIRSTRGYWNTARSWDSLIFAVRCP
jgi:hypothetical protein